MTAVSTSYCRPHLLQVKMERCISFNRVAVSLGRDRLCKRFIPGHILIHGHVSKLTYCTGSAVNTTWSARLNTWQLLQV